MCWRGDTEWALHESDDPRKFMTVKSGEYLLAIPDYTHEARHSVVNRSHGDDDSSSTSSAKNATIFKKVIMKLSGQVQWTAGLVFERDQDDGKRSVDFKPHYEVILRNPKQSPQSLQKVMLHMLRVAFNTDFHTGLRCIQRLQKQPYSSFDCGFCAVRSGLDRDQSKCPEIA